MTSLLPKLGGPLGNITTLPESTDIDAITTTGQVTEVNEVTETDLLPATQRYHTALAVLQENCSGFTAAESSAFVEQKVSELTEWYASYTSLARSIEEFKKAFSADPTFDSGDGELIPRSE